MCVCVCVCVCSRARARAAVIKLLLGSVLKVGFCIMKWNVTYKCVCVCACACVRACVRAQSCRCVYVRLGVVLLVQMGC